MKATTHLVNYQPYPARALHCTIAVSVFAEKDKMQRLLEWTAERHRIYLSQLRQSLSSKAIARISTFKN